MRDFHDDDDAAANLIERRWFAASAKVKALQDECEVMREVMALAEKAYRDARMQLAELETLCDGLSQRLERLEDAGQPLPAFSRAGKEHAASRELTAA
jgi:phosphoglycolate phosphatase-like HAD superfamily hydrolase